MNIVVACPVAERAWVLPDWLNAVRSQHLHPSMRIHIVCLYSRSHDKTFERLVDAHVDVLQAPELPTRGYDRITNHLWDEVDKHEYSLMSALRNRLLSYVGEKYQPDWYFSLDSDVILPDQQSLLHLIDTAYEFAADAVSPLVNLASVEPPAWNWMTLSQVSMMGTREEHVPENPFVTTALMAAVLMNRRAQTIRYRSHDQGEDLGWSVEAYRHQLGLVLNPNIICDHRMRGAPFRDYDAA